MATSVSKLAPRNEQLALPLGTLMNGVLRTARARLDARLDEEQRIWTGYCQHGTAWLLANTEEA
ncbi:MAG: hypothetical protein EON60_02630 [Alphaproteobacteria bacterium]|nr:MAG: hypothetical protein EON60_14110 [Alphaproteobacteria bacterium]RYG61663.1 MAG: hypothetical protein EON60_02630 [Alphaproteobacteria bacterium]